MKADGVVSNVATLTHDEQGTHFVFERRGRTEYFDVWRLARQYLPWTAQDESATPQQHAAFILTDHLVKSSTPVELWSDGHPWQVSFAAAGAVHADTDQGPLTGQWRLKGNFIAVELEDGRRHAWRWLNVADAAGFEIPTKAIRPWESPEHFASSQPVKEQPQAARASTPTPRAARVMKTPKTNAAKLLVEAALQKARAAAERLHQGRDDR